MEPSFYVALVEFKGASALKYGISRDHHARLKTHAATREAVSRIRAAGQVMVLQ